jgi:hypothetical protein
MNNLKAILNIYIYTSYRIIVIILLSLPFLLFKYIVKEINRLVIELYNYYSLFRIKIEFYK